ncbi:aldolase [Nocardioides sp. GY 10113]|nr:aldolase [Nocardioides sp. GY 10113]
MPAVLPDALAEEVDALLADADATLAGRRTRPRAPQPVHTLYVPADRYDADSLARYGAEAAGLLEECADVLGADPAVVERVRARLASRPVDDLRIDFEDGYGVRPDEVEDAEVDRVAALVAGGGRAPEQGIRFKSLEAPTRARGLRTLDRWLAAGAHRAEDHLTLPKVTSVAQVEAMALIARTLEARHGLADGALTFEIQVETAQAVLGPDGTAPLPRMIAAGEGRVTGLHYGTYDYARSLGIAARDQALDHAVADHAKAVMQAAAAGTGVFVCDGSCNVLPVGGAEARAEGWRLHAALVTRSLHRGYYQGWDLHPAQLPSRYLATYAYFRDGLTLALERLDAYLGRQSSTYLDEPATAAALADYVLRAVECGAVDAAEVPHPTADLLDLTAPTTPAGGAG